jgi:RHS repeat-associated protein
MTNQARQVVWKGQYEPFGTVNETVNVVENNLRFPGQYHDRETGLYYNYFRNYDPAIGRYVQSDPVGLLGGMSLYGYANGSPYLEIDPLGLASRQDCINACRENFMSCKDFVLAFTLICNFGCSLIPHMALKLACLGTCAGVVWRIDAQCTFEMQDCMQNCQDNCE